MLHIIVYYHLSIIIPFLLYNYVLFCKTKTEACYIIMYYFVKQNLKLTLYKSMLLSGNRHHVSGVKG